MNPRATAWLAVVTLAVGAFVYFYEIRGEPGRRADAEARGRVFPETTAGTIEAFWIKRPGEPETRLERSDVGWRLVAPLSFPADPASVSGMARVVAEMQSAGRIEDPVSPDVYGLGDDAILVSFSVGTRSHGLRIGRQTPLGPNVYMAVLGDDGDETIHIAPSLQLAAFDRGAEDLRDRRVLSFDPALIQRIAFASPTLAATLERREGGWEIVAPQRLAADGRAVERLLSDLSQLRADSFVDAPDADVLRALEEAATRIDLSGEGVSEVLRLTAADLVQEDTRLAEGRGGHRYRVRTALVAHLPDRLFAFRSKEVARFDAREARSVELDFGSGVRVRVDRPNADVGWTDAEGRVGTEELTGLLDALATLDATDIVADALGPEEQRALGIAPPALAILVGGEVGLLAEIHVGPPEAAGVLVKVHPGEAVHRLAPSFSERLPATAAEFERDFVAVSAAP